MTRSDPETAFACQRCFWSGFHPMTFRIAESYVLCCPQCRADHTLLWGEVYFAREAPDASPAP